MIGPAFRQRIAASSISTLARALGPAYELKFLIDAAVAGQIDDWARARLAADPHGESSLHGAYRTTTLYLDTPALDVYHRTRSYGRRKFRIRRYGLMSSAFLERKTKSGDRVAKRRCEVSATELPRLAQQSAVTDWSGLWFQQRIIARGLQPASRITYCRMAYIGECAEGPLRLTMDREVRGTVCSEWALTGCDDGLPLLPLQTILELKFLRAMPLTFKELVSDFRLNPAIVSKYRLCREAWGVPNSGREIARA